MDLSTFDLSTLNISTVVTLIFGIFVVWNVLGGLFRGLFRQILHIGSAVLWIGGTFVVTDYVSKNYLQGLTTQGLIDLLRENGVAGATFEQIVETISQYDWVMTFELEAILIPIVFAVSFAAMWLVSRIVYAVFKLVLGFGRYPSFFSRLLGAALGALEGFVIAALIFLPVVGLSTVANETIDNISEKNTDGQYPEIVEFYDEYISPVSNHEIIQFIAENGGQDLLDSFATIDYEGQETNILDEATNIATMVIEATGLKDADFAALSAEDQALLRSLVDELEDSKFLSSVVSHFFSAVGGALDTDTLPVEVPAPFDSILKPAVSIFATSTPENLHGDLVTILDVYFLLSDSGTIKAFGSEGAEEQMKAALTERDADGKTLVSKVVDILNKNERTGTLVKTLTEMTLTMMAGQLGGGEYDVQEVYDEIKTGFNTVLEINRESYETDEEYEAARDEEINNTLTEHGIELDGETINELGNYIDENLGDKDELTDEDINNILLHYYEVYSENGEVELP